MIRQFRGVIKEREKRKLFEGDYNLLSKQEQNTEKRFTLDVKDNRPILDEKTITTAFDRHYIYHTAWASRVVNTINPKEHIDISSLLYFSSIISAFIPVRFYDFRPPNLVLNNLKCEKADLTNLQFKANSIHSISCMHVVEHIGLGRYGDSIDYDGDLKAVKELERVVSHGGNLLFVVPIGKEAKIVFNAHRIYTYQSVLRMFSLKLKEFALIPGDPKNGHLIRNASESQVNIETYGCGCFWFVK